MPFTAETESGAAFKGWQLPEVRPSLGLELAGNKYHVLLKGDVAVPCEAAVVLSTYRDNQTEVCVMVLAGDSPQVGERARRVSAVPEFAAQLSAPAPKTGLD